MKFLIVSLAALASALALPVEQQEHQRPIAILRQSNQQSVDHYQFSFETENGIAHSESGQLRALGPKGEAAIVVAGQYQYIDEHGNPVSLTYTADENGYQPISSILPVAPAIPEAIQRSLEYNAAHPEQEEDTFAARKTSRF